MVRFTKEAADDLIHLYAFTAENDSAAANKALELIGKAWEMLEEFPFSCRKADGGDPFLRDVIIPCGATGYIAGERTTLAPGEHVFLPAGTAHRVESCEPGTLWLAVHHYPENA